MKSRPTTYIALLRAVNVGGTGMLPMKDLSSLCLELGFLKVRTYIQSGNVVFESPLTAPKVREKLEAALAKKIGKPVDVIVRKAEEMRSVLEANPFPDASPAKVAVLFLSEPLRKDWPGSLSGPDGEEVRPGKREIYIHYPNGQGRSKLKLPALEGPGTVRNINTVRKLVEMTSRDE